MKIGYKIIIVAFSLGALVYPSKVAYDRYKEFINLRQSETNALLKNFTTRPDNFFADSSYELKVKSYLEKNIKNIQIDLNAPDVPLKVDPVATSETALDTSETTTPNSIETEKTEKTEVTESIINETLKENSKEKTETKEQSKKPVEPKVPEKKEPEKKIIVAGTPVQDKKVDNLQYYAQLGVFKSLENANNLIQKVGAGFVVVKSSVNANQYVVRSNPGTREEIKALSETVKRKDSALTPIIRVW